MTVDLLIVVQFNHKFTTKYQISFFFMGYRKGKLIHLKSLSPIYTNFKLNVMEQVHIVSKLNQSRKTPLKSDTDIFYLSKKMDNFGYKLRFNKPFHFIWLLAYLFKFNSTINLQSNTRHVKSSQFVLSNIINFSGGVGREN